MLDWAFIGLQNGDIMAYDLDRNSFARAFRLPNFWRQKDPNARAAYLVSLTLHPRDVGKLLIGYTHGAVVYSFKQNLPTLFLEYVVPRGAPGGNGAGTETERRPRLTHALWHPSGTFVLTAHDDSSLVLWDSNKEDCRVIMARTLTATDVNEPNAAGRVAPVFNEPYTKIAWCCKENCDDSGLLIAGGHSPDAQNKNMTFIDLGVTPIYATSSYQILGNYFKGKREISLQIPPGAQVTDFILVPRSSPHFHGAQDPIAIIAMVGSGELITLSFPSGYPISPSNQLHPSTFFVHPYIGRVHVSSLERPRWLMMMEKRDVGEPMLKGGAEAAKPKKRFEERTIIQAAHADSIIRIWDSGHADDIENGGTVQVDVARALDRFDDVDVTAMSMGATTGEFAVGTRTGEAVIFRWGKNKYFGQQNAPRLEPNPKGLTDISSRAEPNLKEGLQPFVLYEMMMGPVTAIKISNVGFVAVGSELGFLTLIDLRGPKIIYQAPMTDFAKQEKRGSFLKGHSRSGSSMPDKEWPVVVEFGVMTLDDDKYSSICCFVGTNLGKVITFKLLPTNDGRYSAEVAGVVSFNGPVVSLNAIEANTGRPAAATGQTVAGLREGRQVDGALVAVTQSEIRIFRPGNSKGASKEFDDVFCDAAAVAELELQGFAVVGVFGDKTTRAYSIPALKEIGKASLPMIDSSRITNSIVTETGDVFAWTGPSELAVVHVWGTGKPLQQSDDTMINPQLACPPRPTISNMAWISGTQHVSVLDLDILVGGPDRPPSKRMLEAAAAEQRAARQAGNAAASGGSQEGWGSYLSRQLAERTEKLNIMGDTMDNLQKQSQGWSDDVNKYISKQKRGMVMGAVKSKFF